MTDYKMAMKILLKNDFNAVDFSYARMTAVEAVEKQIPKKPIDICTPVVTWGICPNCKGKLNKLGEGVNRVFKTNAYCPDCGQALDWSEKE